MQGPTGHNASDERGRRALGSEVCYDDLECFDDSSSCHSLRFPPESPTQIGTRFFLYTRLLGSSPDSYQSLNRLDSNSIIASEFDGRLPTKFIIHGYTDTIFSDYFQDIKNSLLVEGNMNVIMVDWQPGARGGYNLCRQNIRVVGREIAMLARLLNREAGAAYEDMHLIGHSLGAHTAGYAGAYQPGFGRITGLDPAGPGFRGVETQCSLDPSDALFVDNIHTDSDDVVGMGLMDPIGHVDFYPNGGVDMPGCALFDVTCDHFRAVYYFEESIRSRHCQFSAYPCDSWNRFLLGFCAKCGLAGCPEMGYNADRSQATGTFYLATNSNEEYCQTQRMK
ncbi:pancreatic lipase-related protein 2-like [Diadema setosum]|uniref:pancreatic lipase-related protein 2-like n=1 Tax=Diadema setosum TaxID=31175 RepID=UPI003B3BA4A9